MVQIIRKMQYDVHPPTQSKTKVLSMSHRYYGIFQKRIIIFGIVIFMALSRLQYYIATADTGTVGISLAEHKSTWMDKYTSHTIVGVSAKHRRFFMVCHEYSQGSIEVSLPRRTGSSCRSGLRNLPSRHRELHSGPHKSHNTTIFAQFIAVSSSYRHRMLIKFLYLYKFLYS